MAKLFQSPYWAYLKLRLTETLRFYPQGAAKRNQLISAVSAISFPLETLREHKFVITWQNTAPSRGLTGNKFSLGLIPGNKI